jgi:hypothetical protein
MEERWNLDYLNRYVASGTDTDHRLPPDVELWTEVIFLAIDDLDRRTRFSSLSDQRSARAWLDSDAEDLGSFVWACQAINVDPDCIRSQLAKKHRLKNRGEMTMRSSAQTSEKLAGTVTDIADQTQSRPSRSEAACLYLVSG